MDDRTLERRSAMRRQSAAWMTYAVVGMFTLSSIFAGQPLLAQGQAKRTVNIAVVGFQPTTQTAETDVIEGIGAYLKGRPDLRLMPSEAVNSFLTSLELQQDAQARGELKQGEEFYKKGKKAYELLKVEEAVGHFESALTVFNQSMPFMESNRYLLLTHLYLGMSKILLKRNDEGRAHIRTMLVLDPQRNTRSLNAKFFPPDIIAIYNKLKKSVQAETKASINLSIEYGGMAEQGGARVLLDGNRVGVAPYQATGIVAGKHQLTVYKRGFERWSQTVELKSGNNNVQASLRRWVPFRSVVDPSGDLSAQTQLKKISGGLQAEVLILGQLEVVDKQKQSIMVRGQLYNVASGEFSKLENLPLEEPSLAKQRGFRLGKQLMDNLTAQGDVIAAGANAFAGAPSTVAPGEGDFKPLTPPTGNVDEKLQPKAVEELPSIRDHELPESFRKQPLPSIERKPPFYKRRNFWLIAGGAVVVLGAGVLLFTDIAKSDADNNILVIDNPGN